MRQKRKKKQSNANEPIYTGILENEAIKNPKTI
jgi:hypothetical protein